MRYRAANESLRERFGGKVYKLSLDGGMTCPTRDGTLHTRGCLFCSAAGSGEFAALGTEGIEVQLAQAKRRVRHKLREEKYIAYFQSFTNTYAPVSYLEPLFRAAMAPPEIVALSIATRPDCLPPPVLDLLEDLNRQKPVWVELGLQTIHASTANYLRRGYDLPCFELAVRELKARGLEVIVHMILGLPGETRDMLAQTADYVGQCGADGVKLQLLHVLDGTDLAEEYRRGQFDILSLEDYIICLEDCLRRLSPEMVIHRLTGDGAKRDLLAPLWSTDKKRVLHQIQTAFRRDDLQQGSLFLGYTKEEL